MNRSVKGSFDADWDDPEQHRQILATRVADAQRMRTELDATLAASPSDDTEDHADAAAEPGAAPGPSVLPGLQPSSEAPTGQSESTPPTSEPPRQEPAAAPDVEGLRAALDDILSHDIELDEDGNAVGIVDRPAGDRMISVTDPEMRHGRKSASVLIAGYKVQIIAAIAYGWILLSRVVRANEHDGAALPALLEELGQRQFEPNWVAGDPAYGTLANHAHFASADKPELIAPMPRPNQADRLSKDDFGVDLHARTVTCPAGHTCSEVNRIATGYPAR